MTTENLALQQIENTDGLIWWKLSEEHRMPRIFNDVPSFGTEFVFGFVQNKISPLRIPFRRPFPRLVIMDKEI